MNRREFVHSILAGLALAWVPVGWGAATFMGTTYYEMRWNRPLSDAEIRAITANPYQIFH